MGLSLAAVTTQEGLASEMWMVRILEFCGFGQG